MTTPVLYLLGTAAPPVLDIGDVIRRAHSDGWDVCLGLTPTAAEWLEDRLPALESLTGRPIRSRHRRPTEVDVWPAADVALVAPATFNTVNHWALGLTSHFVPAFAAEAIGKGIPLVTMPCVNQALAQHPQFERSLATLRDAGVTVLRGAPDVDWDAALSEAGRRID
ncbi:flavoprotein [Streptomyces triculaminicus]|uniref:Flavoprotein n=1 Tax=Streptomyces triculaminicus TaxID=2816232 RepID=A0A939FN25_9ACTN|nr:flavoprotein [Streptomyces triculaminicus]MBO0653734.1 flavoprotein [Streptomyces triculaminicus]